jgi:hypothetical protein
MGDGAGVGDVRPEVGPLEIGRLHDIGVGAIKGKQKTVHQGRAENVRLIHDDALAVKGLVDAPVCEVARGGEQGVVVIDIAAIETILRPDFVVNADQVLIAVLGRRLRNDVVVPEVGEGDEAIQEIDGCLTEPGSGNNIAGERGPGQRIVDHSR